MVDKSPRIKYNGESQQLPTSFRPVPHPMTRSVAETLRKAMTKNMTSEAIFEMS